jgi:hypothetical protein
VHPALFDAALHPVAGARDKGLRLPFTWNGARLYGGAASGSRSLRVRITSAGGEAAAVAAVDDAGTPVLSVASVLPRAYTGGAMVDGPARDDGLWTVGWVPHEGPGAAVAPRVAVLAPGVPWLGDDVAVLAAPGEGEAPDVLVVPAGAGGDPAAAAREACARVLAALRDVLADPAREDVRVAVVTHGGAAAGEEDATAPIPRRRPCGGWCARCSASTPAG